MSLLHLRERIHIPVSVTTFAAAQFLRALPRVRISRAVGRLCEQPLSPRVSRVLERAYVHAYGVNLEEAAPAPGAYQCFDAFFTRRLRAGARRLMAIGW